MDLLASSTEKRLKNLSGHDESKTSKTSKTSKPSKELNDNISGIIVTYLTDIHKSSDSYTIKREKNNYIQERFHTFQDHIYEIKTRTRVLELSPTSQISTHIHKNKKYTVHTYTKIDGKLSVDIHDEDMNKVTEFLPVMAKGLINITSTNNILITEYITSTNFVDEIEGQIRINVVYSNVEEMLNSDKETHLIYHTSKDDIDYLDKIDKYGNLICNLYTNKNDYKALYLAIELEYFVIRYYEKGKIYTITIPVDKEDNEIKTSSFNTGIADLDRDWSIDIKNSRHMFIYQLMDGSKISILFYLHSHIDYELVDNEIISEKLSNNRIVIGDSKKCLLFEDNKFFVKDRKMIITSIMSKDGIDLYYDHDTLSIKMINWSENNDKDFVLLKTKDRFFEQDFYDDEYEMFIKTTGCKWYGYLYMVIQDFIYIYDRSTMKRLHKIEVKPYKYAKILDIVKE